MDHIERIREVNKAPAATVEATAHNDLQRDYLLLRAALVNIAEHPAQAMGAGTVMQAYARTALRDSMIEWHPAGSERAQH